MNTETIKQEIKTRMDQEEDTKIFNSLSGLLGWISRAEGSIEVLLAEADIIQDYGQIRQEIVEGINRFVLIHQPVGHFITAVLSNNLKETFARADNGNSKTLHQIVRYCYNEIPGVCWGTPEKVKAWLETPKEKWIDVMAPETTKEIQRQDGLGIWGWTRFKGGS